MKNRTTLAFVVTAIALASGCAVGPDFERPKPPAVERFTPRELPEQTASIANPGGEAQRFLVGQEVPSQWWTLFRSEPLNQLVDAALKANPDLQAAEAALRAANESALAQRGVYFPTVGASFSPTRQKTAATLASPLAGNDYIFNLHTAQLSVGYVADVFGGTRRQVESAEAQAEAQRCQREAVYLTLTSNVVVAAIQEASLRAQVEAGRHTVSVATRLLEMTRKLRAAGQISAADEAAQEAALAQAQAALPPLEKQLDQQHDLLAILAGRFPGEAPAPSFELSSLTLPADLPVSLPSSLVAQRPDIRAAEAQLHVASAQVGVAIANRLPSFTLSASVGGAALEVSKLFSSGASFWSVGANIAQPVFDGGMLLHRERAAGAAYEQAAAQYRGTVLTAFQNVADVLYALQSDANALAAADAAERAAARSLAIARRQWEAGGLGFLGVLNAQQAYHQAIAGLAQARAARFTDTAALFQALGGGWWNRREGDDSSPR